MQRDGTLGVEFEVVSRQPGTEYVITAIKPGENGRVWIEVDDVSGSEGDAGACGSHGEAGGMTPSEGIANVLAALLGPPATPEQRAAHMAVCAAVLAADERAREPSPQLEMEVAPDGR